eukprot:CAMPEP_0172729116 /NCGR_PEP_ID=MMETSP1074-20121228/93787_1 /TAXON_ID=2916 /ORGANISM="Ceratium fusus, Strain PA161109" /LENGTH=34 /DNA_ID= /DNA_START= /DNA_END= /DNA_ORIENTATION=
MTLACHSAAVAPLHHTNRGSKGHGTNDSCSCETS